MNEPPMLDSNSSPLAPEAGSGSTTETAELNPTVLVSAAQDAGVTFRDATEAEDVAQEAMLKLWQQADGWSAGGQGIAPWLARVTTNLCIDRMRRIRPVTGEALPERADETPLADEQLDEERIRVLTQAALQALPERQRAAIVLTYWQECSNQEAAEALDLNIKAFESLLLRARKALREALVERGLAGAEEAA